MLSKVLSGSVRQHPTSLVDDQLQDGRKSPETVTERHQQFIGHEILTHLKQKGPRAIPLSRWQAGYGSGLRYLGEKEATISKGIDVRLAH